MVVDAVPVLVRAVLCVKCSVMGIFLAGEQLQGFPGQRRGQLVILVGTLAVKLSQQKPCGSFSQSGECHASPGRDILATVYNLSPVSPVFSWIMKKICSKCQLLFRIAYDKMKMTYGVYTAWFRKDRRPRGFSFEVTYLQIEKATYAFQLDGEPVSCREFGHGHINYTLKIDTDTGAEYVLQRINKYVFHEPAQLMANAAAITGYIRERVDDPRLALHFIPTWEGLFYHLDEAGEYWRMYDFVGGFCLDTPQSDMDFYQSALAFGRFQHLLSDFPAETLFETIPEFHNTIDRYRKLKASAMADPLGRLASSRADLDFALAQEEMGSTLQRMREAGTLPLRVTHNDTKLNNVLLDKSTRESLCVLDLDTVMPGLSVYDFGDSIRFGAATAAEDEKNTEKMGLDLHLFQVYTQGYLEAATALTDREIEMLPMGAFVMTLEVGVRFLTDYLDGDLYFKTAYPEHNLVRARSQFALAADMLKKWDDMNRVVAEVAARVRVK